MKDTVLDVQPDSSLALKEADEYTLDDFRKEQAEAKKNSASVEFEKAPEATPPPSEAVRPLAAQPAKDAAATPKQEALTDQQKSERKHANDGKRIPEFLKQIRDKDAEIARLRSEISVKQTPEPAATKTVTDGAPDPKDPKYQGENGWLQFVDDRAEWKADQKFKAYREQQETESKTKTVTEAAHSFAGKVEAYQEANPDTVEDFQEALAIVREALESDFPEISGEIASHEKSPELIHYLGTNLDVFSKVTSAKGKPMARKIFDNIVKEWSAASPVSEATTTGTSTQKPLPKPPVNLNGRGRTPTGEEIQNKAAEDDDFQTWRQAEKAKPKATDKWSRR